MSASSTELGIGPKAVAFWAVAKPMIVAVNKTVRDRDRDGILRQMIVAKLRTKASQ